VNYGIAAPLLSDISSALTSAATSHANGKQPLQRVRLHFAHCETLTPLASLLGLFKPGDAERGDMPAVPSEWGLKAAVKISAEQVSIEQFNALRRLCNRRCVRLHFAHCETLTPLASLLGLFQPGAEKRGEMPAVPSERGLKAAVKISAAQVSKRG
jgi:hypothetical protein